MTLNLVQLTPDEHLAHIRALDKPQAWNPFAHNPADLEVQAIRFRAAQALELIDAGQAGDKRKQRLHAELYN